MLMNPAELFILILFVIISIVTLYLFKNREICSLNFYLRVRSWWWMILVIMLFYFIESLSITWLFLFISVASAWEVASVSKLNKLEKGGLILLLLSTFFSVAHSEMMMLLTCVVAISLFSIYAIYRKAQWALHKEPSTFVFTLILTFSVLMCFTISLQYIVLQGYSESELGFWLYLVMATQFSDVCQYFFGKKFGKHQLSAKISPNKTVEGAIGGILFSSAFSTLLAVAITPLTLLEGVLMSLLLAVLGLAGDLYISWFKRKACVKDMGVLIPGHGGMLDRVDSLLFATPVFVIVLNFLSASIQ